MKNYFTTIILIVTIVLLSSCASSNVALQRAAANSIGNTLSKEVTISNVKRSASSFSWKAKKGDKCYECEADDMVRKVNCKEVKCED